MTTLDAVNQLLASIGEAPVTDIEAGNPEIDLALLTLNQVTREVQAERWHFNREESYPLTPDITGNINVPEGVLFISIGKGVTFPGYGVYNLAVREGKLYDRSSHSFIFPQEVAVSVDIVWGFPFEDLPAPFQLYIAQKAARVFVSRSQGSREMVQLSAVDEERLRANCIAYDTDEQNLNLNQNYDGVTHPTYRPFDAMNRL